MKREIQWNACYSGKLFPPSARGYCEVRGEGLDPSARPDEKEFVDLGLNYEDDGNSPPESRPFKGPNIWPRHVMEELPHVKQDLEAYIVECRRCAEQVLRVTAQALGLKDEKFFESISTDPVIIQRILHYPPVAKFEADGLCISAGKHTDYGLLTLLYQEQYGLQVRSRVAADGEEVWAWVPPPPIPHTFTVNIGDCLQILSNGRFVSTMHRVVNCVPGQDRYSMAFFFDPNFDAMIRPLENGNSDGTENSPKFKPLAAGQVKLAKYQAVWGEEVQIEHDVDKESVEKVLFRQ